MLLMNQGYTIFHFKCEIFRIDIANMPSIFMRPERKIMINEGVCYFFLEMTTEQLTNP